MKTKVKKILSLLSCLVVLIGTGASSLSVFASNNVGAQSSKNIQTEKSIKRTLKSNAVKKNIKQNSSLKTNSDGSTTVKLTDQQLYNILKKTNYPSQSLVSFKRKIKKHHSHSKNGVNSFHYYGHGNFVLKLSRNTLLSIHGTKAAYHIIAIAFAASHLNVPGMAWHLANAINQVIKMGKIHDGRVYVVKHWRLKKVYNQ